MSYKKIVQLFILMFFISYFILFLVVNYVIDPYMETRIMNIKPLKYKFAHSAYASTFLYEKLKNEKSIIVFGTSRSHQINNDDFEFPVLNFHSIYGTPYAVMNFLEQLDEKQIQNINKVYYLIDDLTFNGKERYVEVDYNNNLSKLFFMIKNTNLTKIQDALYSYKNNQQNPKAYINENGSLIFKEELPPFESNNRNHTEPKDVVQRRQEFKKESFLMLKNVNQFFKKYNIEVIYFTAPVTMKYIQLTDINDFIERRKLFLENIDGFYDLSYIKDLSDNDSMFSDFSHTRTAGKNIYLNILKNKDKKYFVTNDNFSEKVEEIKNYFRLVNE